MARIHQTGTRFVSSLLLLLLCVVGVLHFAARDVARASPEGTVTYVTGSDVELVIWRRVGEQVTATVYTLGFADPKVGTGWRPVDQAGSDAEEAAPELVGPFVFETAPSTGGAFSSSEAVVTASGVSWDPRASRFTTVGSSGLTEWQIREGRVSEAVRFALLTVPPGFSTRQRRSPEGGLEEETTMGPPPRTHTTSQRYPRAPEGRLLGRRIGE